MNLRGSGLRLGEEIDDVFKMWIFAKEFVLGGRG